MKETTALFAALEDRLRCFGDDARTRRVIDDACRENAWFAPHDIRRAAEALAGEMLRREALDAWLARYPVPVARPKNVLVVMAGNIPLVGFFDLLCVVASGHRCLVKPSAKDTVLMRHVVETLRELDPRVPVSFFDGREEVDAVIATGGETANRYFRTRYAGIPSLLRGSRQSAAVLSGRESAEELAGLSDDIWAYSGLGCRNVSLVFLPEGYEPKLEIPDVSRKYINNYTQSKALLEMTGTPFVDLGIATAVEQREFPSVLSRIAFWRYRTLQEVEAWLAAHDGELQCVVSECVRHGRRVGFGRAQRPGLDDCPDDRDVVAFLTTLPDRP